LDYYVFYPHFGDSPEEVRQVDGAVLVRKVVGSEMLDLLWVHYRKRLMTPAPY
jgi:hypothetical protein